MHTGFSQNSLELKKLPRLPFSQCSHTLARCTIVPSWGCCHYGRVCRAVRRAVRWRRVALRRPPLLLPGAVPLRRTPLLLRRLRRGGLCKWVHTQCWPFTAGSHLENIVLFQGHLGYSYQFLFDEFVTPSRKGLRLGHNACTFCGRQIYNALWLVHRQPAGWNVSDCSIRAVCVLKALVMSCPCPSECVVYDLRATVTLHANITNVELPWTICIAFCDALWVLKFLWREVFVISVLIMIIY